MANRYWVGGSSTWDGTASGKWATTSGGAPGASVPTAADDVFFDANSLGSTVTISAGNTGAKSINCTGFTGVLAGSAPITISGNLTFPSVGNVSYTGTITFDANATIVSNTRGSSCTFAVNGTGITVQLGDDIFPQNLVVLKGTLTTNNFGITTNRFTCNGADACTINLGSSTVNLINLLTGGGYQLDFSNPNLTLNAGTSLINGANLTTSSTNGTTLFNGGDKTFYDVSVAMTTTIPTNVLTEPSPTFLGNNTFRNLTLNNPYTASSRGFALGGNQTVTGTFTCAGASSTSRYFLYSTPVQTVRTITANAIVADDCDFRDITLAGAAAGASPTRAGDCGGNTGITFPAPKTVYRVGSSTTWYSATNWATSSGGTAASTNIPLPQDTAIFDGSSGSSTVTAGAVNIGSITMAVGSLSGSSRVSFVNGFVYGNLTCNTNTGIGGTVYLYGRGTQGLTSAGRTLSLAVRKRTTVGTFQLNDAFTRADTGNDFYIAGGTFNTNGYAVFANIYYPATSTSATFNFGASSIVSDLSLLGSGLTLNASSCALTVINSLDIGSTNCTFSSITTSSSSAAGVTTFTNTTGSLACTNLTVNAPTSANGLRALSLGLNISVTGLLSFTAGTTSLRRVFLYSNRTGTARTLTCASASGSLADVDFKDITIAGAAAPISGTRFGNGGNNTGITFPSPKTVYWVATTGTSWLSDSWSTTAGGTASLSDFPLAQDTVIFQDGYPTSGTVTLNGCNIGTFDTSSRTTSLTLSATTTGTLYPMVYGDWKFGALTSISNSNIDFNGSSAQTIFSNGRVFNKTSLTIRNLAGVSLNGNLNIVESNLYLNAGTFSVGANNVTAEGFYIESDIAKTLNMGSGVWYLSSRWTLPSTSLSSFTFNKDTATIETVSNSTASFQFTGGGLSYNKLTLTGTGTADFRFIDAGNSFTEVASTRTNTYAIRLGANQGVIERWTVSGSPSNQVTLNSITAGTQYTFNLTNPSTNVNYLTVTDIGVLNVNRFYVGLNSINGGNNTNVYFSEPIIGSFLFFL